MRSSRITAAAVLFAAVAAAARADISVSLMDTGAPKVPDYVDPSGFMQGFTAYILRYTSTDPADTLGTMAFGGGTTGTIYGNFAQLWERGAQSPGVSFYNNSTPSIWNTDTHFLGDPAKVISNVSENAVFTGSGNTHPWAGDNNTYAAFGMGTQLAGVVSVIGPHRTVSYDVAYLVVPTGSPISFTNGEVVTTFQNGYHVSYPHTTPHSRWNANAGGSFNDITKWSSGANWMNFYGNTGGIPNASGAVAEFDGPLAAPATFTVDGNKTLSYLKLHAPAPLTIAPGSGGTITFTNDQVASVISLAPVETGNTPHHIAAPLHLANRLNVSRRIPSDNQTPTRPLLISGTISGDADGALAIGPATNVILTANNSYPGITAVTGTLTLGNGGTTGSVGTGPIVFFPDVSRTPTSTITLAGHLVFNRTDSFTLPNPISGKGNVIKDGPGTVTLTGLTTWSGTTTILNGTLIRTNSGPASDTPLVTLAPNATFSNWMTPQGSLANLMVASTTGLQTLAAFRAGIASGETQVTMRFRARGVSEATALASDVLELSGMTLPNSLKTDTFALELSYSDAGLNEALLAGQGKLYLAWLDEHHRWVNAVDGNIDAGFTVLANYQGSWAQFAQAFGVTDQNLPTFLGSWGVDTASNTAWAILNHNSDFGVTTSIPEPMSLVLLAPALAVMLRRRRVSRARGA